ncbi:MAG: TIGR01458 family HAD-type hydrolase [FCB group bacterium]|nr:TIGR01458 family HAD-type hydrolase [FCB group bacterium]
MISAAFSFSQIKGILFDLDGVLFVDEQIIEGAVETIDYIKSKNIPCRFLTNTTTRSLDSLYKKTSRLGLNIKKEEIFSPPQIAVRYLKKKNNPACLFIVEDDTKKEFREFAEDKDNPDIIVIGHYGRRWNYDLLNKLFKMILNGAELVALHKGKFWQTKDGLTLDIGAFVTALEYATGVKATVIGKPSETFFRLALEDMKVKPRQAVMVGDDIISDIGGAQKTGIKGILVKTGKYRAELVEESEVTPDFTIDSVVSLKELL